MIAFRRVTPPAALALALAMTAAPAPAAAQTAPASSALATWVREKLDERRQAPMETVIAAGGGVIRGSGISGNADAAFLEAALAELRRTFDPAGLDTRDLILFRGFEQGAEHELGAWRWRNHAYVFTDDSGPHLFAVNVAAPTEVQLPPGVTSGRAPDAPPPTEEQIADAYIARLGAATRMIDDAVREFEARAMNGVLPPRRMFPEMIADSRAAIAGAPFTAGPPAPALAAASRHIGGLELGDDAKAELLNRTAAVMVEAWGPSYRRLINALERWEPRAPEAEGLSGIADGDAYYDFLVASQTDGAMTAADARATGERELARIHDELRTAMAGVGFDGTLEAFFDVLRADDRFYFPNTDEGRAAYIAETRRVLAAMEARLDEVLIDPPAGGLNIIRQPAEFEATAPSGMYMPAGASFANDPDSRSENGSYVLNLSDMRAAPKYLLQPLAYHEGLPGHHLQNLMYPRGGPLGGWIGDRSATLAHVEGWGLYAEQLPFEMGLYTDPYANIGRLGMEAWRAARLVVDAGLHADGWTREEVAGFLLANTPLTESQARNEAERYADAPGQATGYMIGKLKILELRARARAALGEDFDLREFHGQLLGHGQMSLATLDEVIDRWIAEKLAG